MIGSCRLCGKEKRLIKKSHIIPDFMYRELYDKKHRIYTLIVDAAKRKLVKKRFRFTGEYQGGLLCKKCDNKLLGSFESYGSKFLYGGNFKKGEDLVMKDFVTADGLSFTEIQNASYEKLKLFLLSILWRCSISDREGFSEISLGEHEEIIRSMIYNTNGGLWDQFPVVIMTYLNDKQLPHDLIAHPQKRITSDGVEVFVLIISGFIYSFFMPPPNGSYPKFVNEATLKEDGTIKILHIPEGHGKDMINSFCGFVL